MKVLAGQLHETVYHTPENKPGESKPLAVKSATTLGMNEVTYIADDIGLHRVHNPSSNQLAVSLHREYLLLSPCLLPDTNNTSSVYPTKCRRLRLQYL